MTGPGGRQGVEERGDLVLEAQDFGAMGERLLLMLEPVPRAAPEVHRLDEGLEGLGPCAVVALAESLVEGPPFGSRRLEPVPELGVVHARRRACLLDVVQRR